MPLASAADHSSAALYLRTAIRMQVQFGEEQLRVSAKLVDRRAVRLGDMLFEFGQLH